jgi:hypothetical protein
LTPLRSCFTACPHGSSFTEAASWHGLGQFEAAVAVARDKICAGNVVGSTQMVKKAAKVRPIEKN